MHLKQNKKTKLNQTNPQNPRATQIIFNSEQKKKSKTEEKYYVRKCNLISSNREQKHKYYHQIGALVPLILYSANSSQHVPGVRQEVKRNC